MNIVDHTKTDFAPFIVLLTFYEIKRNMIMHFVFRQVQRDDPWCREYNTGGLLGLWGTAYILHDPSNLHIGPLPILLGV